MVYFRGMWLNRLFFAQNDIVRLFAKKILLYLITLQTLQATNQQNSTHLLINDFQNCTDGPTTSVMNRRNTFTK